MGSFVGEESNGDPTLVWHSTSGSLVPLIIVSFQLLFNSQYGNVNGVLLCHRFKVFSRTFHDESCITGFHILSQCCGLITAVHVCHYSLCVAPLLLGVFISKSTAAGASHPVSSEKFPKQQLPSVSASQFHVEITNATGLNYNAILDLTVLGMNHL